MTDDWNSYSKSNFEYDILCRNYEIGRKVTIGYAGKNQIAWIILYITIIYYYIIYIADTPMKNYIGKLETNWLTPLLLSVT